MAPLCTMPDHYISCRRAGDVRSCHLAAADRQNLGQQTKTDPPVSRIETKQGIKRFLHLPRKFHRQAAPVASPASVAPVASEPKTEHNDEPNLAVSDKHWSHKVLRIIGKPSSGNIHCLNWLRQICKKHAPESVAAKQEVSPRPSVAFSWNSGDDANVWYRGMLKDAQEIFAHDQQYSFRANMDISESTQPSELVPSPNHSDFDDIEALATTASLDDSLGNDTGAAESAKDHSLSTFSIRVVSSEVPTDVVEVHGKEFDHQVESDPVPDEIQSSEHSGSEQFEECCSLVSAGHQEGDGCTSPSYTEPGLATPEDDTVVPWDPKNPTLENRFGLTQERWDAIGRRMKDMMDQYDVNPEPLDNHHKAVAEIMDRYAPQFDPKLSADKASSDSKASSATSIDEKKKKQKKEKRVKGMNSASKTTKTRVASKTSVKAVASSAEASKEPITGAPRDADFGIFKIPEEHKAPAKPAFDFSNFSTWQETIPADLRIPVNQPVSHVPKDVAQPVEQTPADKEKERI